MALELKRICEKCGGTLTTSGVAYICSYECTYCGGCAEETELRLSKLRRRAGAAAAPQGVD